LAAGTIEESDDLGDLAILLLYAFMLGVQGVAFLAFGMGLIAVRKSRCH
jgi:hypothetical protein